MDGNGRWATARGLPRVAGHRAGVEAVRTVVRTCGDLGIPVVTLYAFSTENWKRPKAEVDALMHLLVEYLYKDIEDLAQRGVRVQALGRIDELSGAERKAVARAVERTRGNEQLLLNIALNYGGRTELVDAVRRIIARVQAGDLDPAQVDADCLAAHLYTSGVVDPDLVIRTAGEQRLSNFLLWQSAYAEFWVTETLWPDFDAAELSAAIDDFSSRERRFGGIVCQE